MKYALGNMLNGAGGLNADGLSLDLQFAADKTLTARKGPTPVFTRGTMATEIGPDGLVRYAPENLILQSENFGTTWTNDAGNIAVSTDVITSPSGLVNADKITENTSTTVRRICIGPVTVIETVYTFSCYLKAGERDFAQLAFGGTFGNQYQNFIIGGVDAGTLGSGSGITSPQITALPDGWYRCTATVTSAGSGSTQVTVGPLDSNRASKWPGYLGTIGSGIYAWGAQLERHTSARAYIPTTTAAVYGPRFDHDPLTLACKGLLIEEGRTNSITGSDAFNTWTTTNASVVASSVSTPEGTADAWKVVEDLLLNIHTVTRSFTPVSGTTYTASVWLKAAENGFAFVGLVGTGFATFTLISVDLSTGAVTTATGSPVGATSVAHSNGWWRVSVSQVATSSASSNIDIRLSRDGVFANRSYLGNGVNGMYVYGAQVEAGSFPTSYIPTTTAALARSADVCSITGSDFSGLWNTGGGTFLFEGFLIPSAAVNLRMLSSGSSRRWLYGNNPGGGSISETVTAFDGSLVQNYFTNVRIAVKFKIAISVESLTSKASFNGSAINTVSHNGNLLSSVTLLGFFENASGFITGVKYYRKNLSNQKLQTLTT